MTVTYINLWDELLSDSTSDGNDTEKPAMEKERETGIGTVVNTNIVIATGNALVSKDANLLSSITLTKAWVKYHCIEQSL